MKPNYTLTLREKIAQAKRFDNLSKRPNTADYEWWDDCERRETQPKQVTRFPLNVVHTP